MTTYYVGKGGSDSNNGLSWANRKLTLNGAEDIPLVANDTVYVGPGSYREQLTCDVSGSSGNQITYIGDPTGANTDGIGGIVRITGSDDDLAATRSYCIDSNSQDYRTFRGFFLDEATSTLLSIENDETGWVVEDCVFHADNNDHVQGIYYRPNSNNQLFEFRRCVFHVPGRQIRILDIFGDYYTNPASVIENCVFRLHSFSPASPGISFAVEDVVIRNCTFLAGGLSTHIQSSFETVSSGECYVYNCVFIQGNIGIDITGGTGTVVEDYNTFSLLAATTDGTPGSNSDEDVVLQEFPMLFAGTIFPCDYFAPSKWDQKRYITGTSEATDDLYGLTRPATSGKKSRGAIQYKPGIRSESIKRESPTSIYLEDAGNYIVLVPVNPVSTTISVYVLREQNYAGTLPQMIIREPGQADRVTTDVGAVKSYNALTDTFTPSGDTDYVFVLLRSNNTGSSGAYGVHFADFDVNI